jgi:hypothetical protein
MILRNNTTLLEVMTTLYQMDHTAERKRPSSARVHKYFPYLAHQFGYQRFRVTYGTLHRYIQTEMEFLDILSWTWPTDMSSKSSRSSNKRRSNLGLGTLTTKPRKGWPQPIEQRIEKRWIVSGQLFQAARKEGH